MGSKKIAAGRGIIRQPQGNVDQASHADQSPNNLPKPSTQAAPSAQQILDEHADAIRAHAKRTVHDIIEIGRHLAEVKKMLGHGNFLPWIEREFRWSEDTAERLISLYALQGQIRNVAKLSLPISGLYMLAAPSTPPEAVEAIVAKAEDGDRVTVAEIKATIAKGRRPKPLSQRGYRKKLIAEAEKQGIKSPAFLTNRELMDDLAQKNVDDAEASAEKRKAENAAVENGASAGSKSEHKAAVSAKDTGSSEFDGHILRLLQMIKNQRAGRLALKTAVPAADLSRLGEFLKAVATERAGTAA